MFSLNEADISKANSIINNISNMVKSNPTKASDYLNDNDKYIDIITKGVVYDSEVFATKLFNSATSVD